MKNKKRKFFTKEQLRKCLKPTKKERLSSIDYSRNKISKLEDKIGLSYDKVIEKLKSGEISETLDVCYLLMEKQMLDYSLLHFNQAEKEANSYIKSTPWQEIKQARKNKKNH